MIKNKNSANYMIKNVTTHITMMPKSLGPRKIVKEVVLLNKSLI